MSSPFQQYNPVVLDDISMAERQVFEFLVMLAEGSPDVDLSDVRVFISSVKSKKYELLRTLDSNSGVASNPDGGYLITIDADGLPTNTKLIVEYSFFNTGSVDIIQNLKIHESSVTPTST